MSDKNEQEEGEIVDLDTCSKKKSILIAAAITAVLGFVSYSYIFLCMHYIFGGFAAAGGFAKRYSITIPAGTGAKLGAVSAFLGMLVTFSIFIVLFYNGVADEMIEQFRGEMLQRLYEEGRAEAADWFETFSLDRIRLLIVFAFVAAGSALSLILGALGGVIGASVFKKGPLAQ